MARKVGFAVGAAVMALMLVFLLISAERTAAQAQSPDTEDVPAGYLPVTVDPAIARDNLILFWDNVALDAIRAEPPGPPMVARILAMVHTAQYEAWSQYNDPAVGTLLGDRFRRPIDEHTLENKNIAVSYAAYRVLVDLFPRRTRTFDSKMVDVLNYDPAVVTTDPSTPEGIGNLAGAAVLFHRRYDGANQLGGYADTTGYRPVNTPDQVVDLNRWQPLRTANGNQQGVCLSGGELITQTYIGPHWGGVLPFALDDGSQITTTAGPIRHPSPEFIAQAQDVISYSAHLTDYGVAISQYWADGPFSEFPPGHWALFSQFVSFRDGHGIDEDARLFLAVNNATFDAGIVAWKLKRIFDSVRPITAIRELFQGQEIVAWGGPYSGTQTIRGEEWQPYQEDCFVTPAFAEFVSGHSAFSAAAAAVLRSFTGSDEFGAYHLYRVGESPVEPNFAPSRSVLLLWKTFTDAADEAGLSRRYGGIHFVEGDLQGRDVGRRAGERVWQKALGFFDGSAPPVADMTAVLNDLLLRDNVYHSLYPQRVVYIPLVGGE
ncbi:MAG: phosphoesterase [Chloroflexi bacterium]|nr:phosphoesterase [Chloroflexota bacterium]